MKNVTKKYKLREQSLYIFRNIEFTLCKCKCKINANKKVLNEKKYIH